MSPILPDIHAIAQCANYAHDVDEDDNFLMFKRMQKHVGGFTDGMVSHLSLTLATVGAFVQEIVVIPNLGGQPNMHFELLPRNKWRCMLIEWLNMDVDCVSDSSVDLDSDTNARQNFDERGEDSRSKSSQLSQSNNDGLLQDE